MESLDNFLGVVQSRDYRRPECSGYGENTRITYLRINMMAQAEDKEYCGVFISEVSFVFFNLASSYNLTVHPRKIVKQKELGRFRNRAFFIKCYHKWAKLLRKY